LKLYCQLPPIQKMDAALGTLRNCEYVDWEWIWAVDDSQSSPFFCFFAVDASLYQRITLTGYQTWRVWQGWRSYPWAEIWLRRYACGVSFMSAHISYEFMTDWETGRSFSNFGGVMGQLQSNFLFGWTFLLHQFDHAVYLK
jgi:hypothetical protein